MWGKSVGVALAMGVGLVQGATIVSTGPVTDPGFRSIFGAAGATAWSTTSAYQNVSISAWLSGSAAVGGLTTGPLEAYLTTSIGPGATSATQVASTVINVSLPSASSVEVSLFSGLTLAPGTYYLVLSGNFPLLPAQWAECQSPSCAATVAADATLLNSQIFVGGGLPAYRPSAAFLSFLANGITSEEWAFSVTGDPVTGGGTGGGGTTGGGTTGGGTTGASGGGEVPEPSTVALAGLALTGLALRRVRRS